MSNIHNFPNVTECLQCVCICRADKESAFEASFDQLEPELQEYVCDVWEAQFCPVADQLLQRIETHNSDFEPL